MRAAPALALAIVLALALPAATAHANLRTADPAPNAKLDPDALPVEVVLAFTEPLDRSYSRIQLLDGDQREVAPEPSRVTTEMEMRLAFPDALPDGIYTLTWRALSTVDGHTTAGAFVYIVGNASVPESFDDIVVRSQAPTTSADSGGAMENAGRGLFYLGSFLVTGVAFFVIALAGPVGAASPAYRRAAGRLALAGALVGVAGALVASAGFAGRVTDAAFTLGEWWSRIAGTRIGLLWAGRAGALAVAALAILAAPRSPRVMWTTAAVAGSAALFFQALASHSAAVAYPALGVALDLVHLVTGAAWLGGLPALAIALRSADTRMRRAALAAAFSVLATWSLAAVVLTGAALSFSLLGNVANLWLTPWGRALAAKLLLVLALIGFGAFNQFVLVPRVREDDPRAIRRLWRSVLVESALAVVLVALVVVLTANSPPASEAPAPAATSPDADGILELSKEGRYGTNFTLRIGPAEPLEPGLHLYEANLSNATSTVPDANVTIRFTFLEEDIGTSEAETEHVGNGTYRTLSGNLALPGLWRVEVHAKGRPDAFDEWVAFDLTVEG